MNIFKTELSEEQFKTFLPFYKAGINNNKNGKKSFDSSLNEIEIQNVLKALNEFMINGENRVVLKLFPILLKGLLTFLISAFKNWDKNYQNLRKQIEDLALAYKQRKSNKKDKKNKTKNEALFDKEAFRIVKMNLDKFEKEFTPKLLKPKLSENISMKGITLPEAPNFHDDDMDYSYIDNVKLNFNIDSNVNSSIDCNIPDFHESEYDTETNEFDDAMMISFSSLKSTPNRSLNISPSTTLTKSQQFKTPKIKQKTKVKTEKRKYLLKKKRSKTLSTTKKSQTSARRSARKMKAAANVSFFSNYSDAVLQDLLNRTASESFDLDSDLSMINEDFHIPSVSVPIHEKKIEENVLKNKIIQIIQKSQEQKIHFQELLDILDYKTPDSVIVCFNVLLNCDNFKLSNENEDFRKFYRILIENLYKP